MLDYYTWIFGKSLQDKDDHYIAGQDCCTGVFESALLRHKKQSTGSMSAMAPSFHSQGTGQCHTSGSACQPLHRPCRRCWGEGCHSPGTASPAHHCMNDCTFPSCPKGPSCHEWDKDRCCKNQLVCCFLHICDLQTVGLGLSIGVSSDCCLPHRTQCRRSSCPMGPTSRPLVRKAQHRTVTASDAGDKVSQLHQANIDCCTLLTLPVECLRYAGVSTYRFSVVKAGEQHDLQVSCDPTTFMVRDH